MDAIEIKLTQEEVIELLLTVDMKLKAIRGYHIHMSCEKTLEILMIKLKDSYTKIIKQKIENGN